jgi:Ca-activated chloride channel family protein
LGAALQNASSMPVIRSNIANAVVNYKLPGDSVKRSSTYGVGYSYSPFNELPQCYRFATTVAMFGSLLKESMYSKNVTWNDTVIAANETYDKNDPVQKEFISIIEKAKKIYSRKKKRFL